jgi:two-component system, sporulation sensor kinase E
MNSGFLDKLIERISRVQPQEVESYLLRLADEKGFLETIFNAIHEGVIVTDLKGRVSYLNRAACEFFSLAREQAMGKPLKECIKGLEWETMFATGTLISRDMEVFYPQHRYLNFYIEPLQLEEPQSTRKGTESFNKEAVGFAVILRDITENRKSTEETIHSERLSALTLLAAGA